MNLRFSYFIRCPLCFNMCIIKSIDCTLITKENKQKDVYTATQERYKIQKMIRYKKQHTLQ